MHGSTLDQVLIWTAAVGQAYFVILWATQRWWTTHVGHALMAKSLSLGVILGATVWGYYQGPLPLWLSRLPLRLRRRRHHRAVSGPLRRGRPRTEAAAASHGHEGETRRGGARLLAPRAGVWVLSSHDH